MTWLLTALRTRLGRAAALALAFLAALGLAWKKGHSRARSEAQKDALENEVEAHDRINRAETGADVDDDERVERLSRIGRGDWPGY
jgi:hypothetical protein